MAKKNIAGEKFIESILHDLGIKYDQKKRLMNLKKDSKKYRIPDFFLPKYNLVIEYFGSWYDAKNKKFEKRERARFMEKVGAYEHSGINCLYIYPEDLDKSKKLIQDKIKEIKNKEIHVKIAETIVNDKKKSITIVKKTHIRPGRDPVMVHVEPKEIPRRLKNRNQGDTTLLKKIILFLAAIEVVLFIFLASIVSILMYQGNPLGSELGIALEIIYSVFLGIAILSIILSAIFAFLKDLSHGFIMVAIVLVAFFVMMTFFFGDPFARIITVLVTLLAVIPSEFYMVTTNK
jgi:hypothetical protein